MPPTEARQPTSPYEAQFGQLRKFGAHARITAKEALQRC
jgi:hypothetical protein